MKPVVIKNNDDYLRLSEGDFCIDPQGNLRKKDKSLHWWSAPVRGWKPSPNAAQLRSWATAVWSWLRRGNVSADTFLRRCEQCVSKKVDDAGNTYCMSCDCDDRHLAEFQFRMQMPTISCKKCGIEPAPGTGHRPLSMLGQMRELMKGLLDEYRRTRFYDEGEGL